MGRGACGGNRVVLRRIALRQRATGVLPQSSRGGALPSWRSQQKVKEPQMTSVAVQPATEPKHGPQRGDTIRRFFAAIQAGDYPVLLELLTPDAITRWPQSG